MAERAKILIIEDDEDTVEAMKITLEAENYRVLSAFNPDEGLKKARDERPDLIILDVMFGKKEKSKGFDYAIKMKQERALAHCLEVFVPGHQPQLTQGLHRPPPRWHRADARPRPR